MPRTVTLQATKRHPFRDTGEVYEATTNTALVDLYKGHAVGYKPGKPEIKNEPKPLRKKRPYKRRDMRPE